MGISSALGLIELIGLTTAIVCADSAVKAANVRLLGYEITRGGGLVTVKITGNVAAVQAGVSAGVASASKVGKVVSHLVIPRPHRDLETIVDTAETVKDTGLKKKAVEYDDDTNTPAVKENSAPAEPPGIETVESEDDEIGSGLEQPDAGGELEGSPETGDEPDPLASAVRLENESPDEPDEPAEQPNPVPSPQKATCNVCGDPDCPRMKGEPRSLCIHHNSEN